MKDPSTLNDEQYETPPPFEGQQELTFEDYDLKEKEYGFWLLLNFASASGERASWSGNFYRAPDTSGRKQAHNIAWRGLRDFLKACGLTDADLPKASAREIAEKLNALVSVDGNPIHIKANVGPDEKGFMNASRFKAA